MRKFKQHHITEASITRSDSRKGLLDSATQRAINKNCLSGTKSEITQDKATQVNESMLRAEDVQRSRATCPLQRLPLEITQYILGMLDVVSLVCLRMTSRRLRQVTRVRRRDLNRCVRWRVTCLMEEDLKAKGAPVPRKLACAFCKCTHRRKMFGLPGTNVGYGIECVGMTKSPPAIRHCWRHMPKRFCYSPAYRDSQRGIWARGLQRERWIATKQMTCLHCGTRLEKNVHSGEKECPTCWRQCDVCGHAELPFLTRFGPRRRLDSLKRLRLVRRKKTGYLLEMQDHNGISRNPKGIKYHRRTLVEIDVTNNAW